MGWFGWKIERPGLPGASIIYQPATRFEPLGAAGPSHCGRSGGGICSIQRAGTVAEGDSRRCAVRILLTPPAIPWKCADPCRKTTFLVERAFVHLNASCGEGRLLAFLVLFIFSTGGSKQQSVLLPYQGLERVCPCARVRG